MDSNVSRTKTNPTVNNLRQQKRTLRADHRERRHIMTALERETTSARITRNLIELSGIFSTRSVACYLSTPFEPSTRDYLQWASQANLRTLLPVTREDGLLDWTTGSGDKEIEEPPQESKNTSELLGPSALTTVDLIIAPAAAVDHKGVRLGWGHGYFDKTIALVGKCPPVYAVVFDNEVLDFVPQEKHDQLVDGVVTPTQIVSFTTHRHPSHLSKHRPSHDRRK